MTTFNKDKFLAEHPQLSPAGLNGFGDFFILELVGSQICKVNQRVDRNRTEKDPDFAKSIGLVAEAVRDKDKNRIFEDADIAKLRELPPRVLMPMISKVMELSGLNEDAMLKSQAIQPSDTGTD